MNYFLFAWGANCHSIELLQKKTVRVISFKFSPDHTEPIFKGMDQLKLPDMYTCHLVKFYYKLYRSKIIDTLIILYLNMANLCMTYVRHNNIRLPVIMCEYKKNEPKHQMHYKLRELANPSRPPLYPFV